MDEISWRKKKELFEDIVRSTTEQQDNQIIRTRSTITKDKICNTINQAKNGKAVGPVDLPAEIIKLIDEDNICLLEVIFDRIYDEG